VLLIPCMWGYQNTFHFLSMLPVCISGSINLQFRRGSCKAGALRCSAHFEPPNCMHPFLSWKGKESLGQPTYTLFSCTSRFEEGQLAN
jgi:hypothetical protein